MLGFRWPRRQEQRHAGILLASTGHLAEWRGGGLSADDAANRVALNMALLRNGEVRSFRKSAAFKADLGPGRAVLFIAAPLHDEYEFFVSRLISEAPFAPALDLGKVADWELDSIDSLFRALADQLPQAPTARVSERPIPRQQYETFINNEMAEATLVFSVVATLKEATEAGARKAPSVLTEWMRYFAGNDAEMAARKKSSLAIFHISTDGKPESAQNAIDFIEQTAREHERSMRWPEQFSQLDRPTLAKWTDMSWARTFEPRQLRDRLDNLPEAMVSTEDGSESFRAARIAMKRHMQPSVENAQPAAWVHR